MALSDLEQIVALAGARCVLCLGGNNPALGLQLRGHGASVDFVNELAELAAWDSATFAHYDCLIVEASAMMEVGTLQSSFAELHRLEARHVVIRFSEHRDLIRTSREVGPRAAWESAAFAAGFRRAPQSVTPASYADESNDPGVPALIAFERIAPAALALAGAGADMTRQSGPRADARMLRYALAASLVRSGDTVLDYGCSAGAGSAILAACSAAARVLGLCEDGALQAYASAHFGAAYGIELFGIEALAQLDDDSVDLVVCVDSQADYRAFLQQAQRVLKPDGRLVVAVADGWADDSGSGKKAKLFDFTALRDALGEFFLLEQRYAQTAHGGRRLARSPCALTALAPGAPAMPTEWMIVVAAVDPLSKQSSRPYGDAQLAQHYDNPWLLRAMVERGARLRNPALLTDLAARALGTLPIDSADFGAALTVLGHALLDQPVSQHVDDLMPVIDAYLGQDMPNPHAKRWQMTAALVAGRIALARGERALARMYLNAVEQADYMLFNAALARQPVTAAFLLGTMALADADGMAADHFAAGLRISRAAQAQEQAQEQAQAAEHAVEMAELAAMGAQCALALALLPLAAANPGRFWRRIDSSCFGLSA
jgi:SAM-dependent methyltransferase